MKVHAERYGRLLVDSLIALLIVLAIGIFAYHIRNKPVADVIGSGGLENQAPPYLRVELLLGEEWKDEKLRGLLKPGSMLTNDDVSFGRIVELNEQRLTVDVISTTFESWMTTPGAPAVIRSDKMIIRGTFLEVKSRKYSLEELSRLD